MTAVDTLAHWNATDAASATEIILPCCGSRAWAESMSRARPVDDPEHLLALAGSIWYSLPLTAWQEAFESHPRIGKANGAPARGRSAAWSEAEQADAQSDETVAAALARANAAYEARFGRIFLICASGRSAKGILAEATRRMSNDDAEELRETVEQQRQITALRLRRWLAEGA